MSDAFADVRILDNFYQTSGFFPMPVVLVSTIAESGQTNLGPYSLCFPHIITGGKDHAMLLIARGTSNTAENILRTKRCSLNFIPHKRRYMKNCVLLGYPGDKTEDKMKESIFTLLPSTRSGGDGAPYPEIVKEAVQVFECTWDERFPLKHDESLVESHFVLRIDKLLLKQRWRDRLLKGKGFPSLPINYGYRDNVRFWFTGHSGPYAVPIPKNKGNAIEVVRYACQRFDPEIVWEDAACAKIVKVPGIFLNKVIGGVVAEARKQGLTVITPELMDQIRNKRSAEK